MASPSPPPPPPDWSTMPRKFLEALIGSIDMLPDQLAAAAVCTSWHAAAAAVLGPAMTPRRLLWQLTVPSGGGETSDAELYDMFNGVSRRTTLPGVAVGSGWKICGSSRGWLLVMHGLDRQLSLVSPFTGAHISLPHCPPGLEPRKAAVYSGPSSGSYRVLLFSGSELYVAVSGDREWHLERRITRWMLYDCIYYGGRFLAVDGEGTVMDWAAGSAPQITLRAPCYYVIHSFLLAAPWGKLLLARMRVRQRRPDGHFAPAGFQVPDGFFAPAGFEVFIVHLTEKRLERTEDLHGHTMIIDTKQCSLVSAKCHPTLSADTVIFFSSRLLLWDWEMEFPYRQSSRNRFDAGVYNLRSRSFLPLPPSLQPPGDSFKLSMLVIPPTVEV